LVEIAVSEAVLREDTTVNLLGALGVAVMDRIHEGLEEVAGHGGQGAAALVTIGMLPGLSIGDLAGVLGLTHPGTVRLVDRLVQDDLVEKAPAEEDGRTLSLKLTPLGKQRRREILALRAKRLQPLLDVLAPNERKQFDNLLRKMLSNLTASRRKAYTVCRYCDAGACFRNNCPVDMGCQGADDGIAVPMGRR
jgi:MarR family transcriptional repressor of emrRAB